jgi:hypothetical protein
MELSEYAVENGVLQHTLEVKLGWACMVSITWAHIDTAGERKIAAGIAESIRRGTWNCRLPARKRNT